MANEQNEMLQDFIDEANDLLENIEEDFLRLEEQGQYADSELINKCFRAVHTIKGTSGFIGLKNIGLVSHAMETMMSFFREKTIAPQKILIDSLLEGADILKKMIGNIGQSDSMDVGGIVNHIKDLNQKITNGENFVSAKPINAIDSNATIKGGDGLNTKEIPISHLPDKENDSPKNAKTTTSLFNGEKEFLRDFILEANKYLQNFEIFCETYSKTGKKLDIAYLQSIQNSITAIKSTSAFIQLNKISQLAEALRKSLTFLKETQPDNLSEYAKKMLIVKDRMQVLIDDIENSEQANIEDLINVLHFEDNQPEIIISPVLSETLPKEIAENAPVSKANKISEAIIKETIRVPVPLIDKLMRLAGELVLIRNQQLLQFQQTKIGNREIIQRLDSVTSEIQETIMQTRLQPLSNLFNKFLRVVRDLGNSLGKEIEIETHGGEVELDKTILEEIAGPLTHLIRNSADHGIETPDERRKSGKKTLGKIKLFAENEGGIIIIRIEDDGHGLNTEKIKTKALTNGLIAPQVLAKMNDQEVMNLIFMPGFSTADKLTEVSGRGVGMDVVRTSIEKLSGSIELASQWGQGTIVTLKLPLTLAIIPSLIVSSGKYRYAIPQVNLEILISIPKNEIHEKIEKAGSQEIYRLQDALLPIVRLDEILLHKQKFSLNDKYNIISKYHNEQNTWTVNEESLTIAVLGAGNRKYGIIFDKVIGAEEIVVKPMHPAVKNLKIYSGATIMGDGSVALILDAEGIAEHAAIEFNVNLANSFLQLGEKQQKEAVLIFRSGERERFALSLQLIRRIVEIEKHQIEQVGKKDFVNVEGRSIRLFRLDEILDVSPILNRELQYLILFKHVDKPIGLLISSLVDIVEVFVDLKKNSYSQKGLLGSDIIQDKMTLFLDIYYLFSKAEPDWFARYEVDQTAKKSKNKIKVLVIDDSSIFRQMISKYLIEDGFNIETAENGQNAIEKIQKTTFDFIVSDIEMPIMNGLDFMKNYRKNESGKKIPTLALSSINDEHIVSEAKKAGFNEYEVKLEREHFLNKVNSMLGLR